MAWTVEYLSSTRKQLRKLDPQGRERILRYMRELVAVDGAAWERGKGLSGVWSGYWRYRAGDYRIICLVRADVLVVHVVRVGQRKSVYDQPPTAEMLSLLDARLKVVEKDKS